ALDSLLRFGQALAGPQGAVEVRVLAADGRAAAEIRSLGAALASDDLAGLFNRFSAQLHGKSGGLGLYVARGVAEAHGGELTVEPVPAGVLVILALPVG
ncbi:MAG TPA: sensor histidine kinase, partial [Herpetosiphonaceae bacterium]